MLYEIKVVIKKIEPPIWRVIHVPSRTSLTRLHKILQKVMGWSNSHLHLFKVDGLLYGEPDPDWDYVLDEAKLTLEEVFAGGKKSFHYEYDMGDCWVHEITLKKQIESEVSKPVCIAGARACPPEDCGGPSGYQNLLEAISDPEHEEHETLLEWVGEGYDPEAFDLEIANISLSRLR